MLVLSRKPGEKVVIGNGITLTVLKAIGDLVRIGIEAPDDVCILWAELACWQEEPAGCQTSDRYNEETASSGSPRRIVTSGH